MRDHGNNPQWTPHKGPGGTLCLHAANSLFRRTQTVCSLVASIGKENNFYYTTGAPSPCLSPYFPVFYYNTEVPKEYKEGSAVYNQNSYWWESEYYHRKALKYFHLAFMEVQHLINHYEEKMIAGIENTHGDINQDRIDRYFVQARDIMRNWGSGLDKHPSMQLSWYYRYYWREYNRRNKIF